MIKLNILFLLCFMLSSIMLHAQKIDSLSHHWGGNLMDHSYAITTDSSGNVYATGGFQSSVKFGNNIINSNGDTDIFLVKYNSNGMLAWSLSAGSDTLADFTLSEYGTDVVTDNNFVYVTGLFLSKAKFGATELKSHGGGDIFLAKFSVDGQLIWVKSAGGATQDIPHALTLDQEGAIYVTGSFQNVAFFGDQTLHATNSTEMFLAKYDKDGNVLWVKKSDNELKGVGKAIMCAENYCIVSGEFESEVEFDNNTRIASNKHESGIFVNQYTLDGQLLWSTKALESDRVSVEDLVVWRGGVYLTGSFSGDLSSGSKRRSSQGNFDAYVAKVDINGNDVWLNTFGGKGVDGGKNLHVSENSQLLVSGVFQNRFKVNNHVFDSNGSDDFFIASYSTNGVLNWNKTFGGSGQDRLTGAAIHKNSLFLTGYFMDEMRVGNEVYVSAGSSDSFLIRSTIQDTMPSGSDLNVQVLLYPNPSPGKFMILSEEPVSHITIYNVSGQLIYESSPAPSTKLEVSLKDHPTGVFVVKVLAKNKYHEIKMILDN